MAGIHPVAKAYKKLSLVYHPDKTAGMGAEQKEESPGRTWWVVGSHDRSWSRNILETGRHGISKNHHGWVVNPASNATFLHVSGVGFTNLHIHWGELTHSPSEMSPKGPVQQDSRQGLGHNNQGQYKYELKIGLMIDHGH